MFFTYVFRELRRRHRQALLTAMGLAVGVALVVAVTAYAAGVGKAQDQVLQSLYGVGTDITVSQQQKMDQSGAQRFGMQPPDQSKQGQKFSRSRVMTSPGQQSISAQKLAQIASLDGVDSATGSITMSVMSVAGKFAQAQGGSAAALVPWHVAAGERRRRAGEALAGVGLADRARHIPSELSGGEQQRVAIARALVRAPRVILADEPTGNLDERTRDDIIGLLEQLWRERGQTLIVVTHDTWVASRASRRIWLEAGRREEEATADPDVDGRFLEVAAAAV